MPVIIFDDPVSRIEKLTNVSPYVMGERKMGHLMG